MKVFGWQADFSGCAWYRLILPLGSMRQFDGVTAEWGKRIEERHWEYDVIVAQRTCLAPPSSTFQRLCKTKTKRPLMVLELDDDLLSLDQHNPSAGFFNTPEIRDNLIANLRLADLVTVSTEPLARRMRRFNDNIAVLPNCIPRDLFDWQPGRYLDRVTIGWQGSSTHAGDWEPAALPIARWFGEAKRTGLPVEFHTIGSTPDTFPQIYPHRVSPWIREIDRYYRLLDWHIAVAPLADTLFNRSKSDLRCLEAGVLGFPVVASHVPAYAEYVEHGKTGFLVKTPADWARYLQRLAVDPDLRASMGEAARALAATRVVEDNAYRWLEAYRR